MILRIKPILFSATLLSLCSCDLFRKEADRTQSQLYGLAKDVGAVEAAEVVGEAYKKNVAPAVAPVTNLADAAIKNAESVAAINSAMTSVAESTDEIQLQAEQYSNQVTKSMPKSEREVVGTVNYYQARFTKWLLSFNPNFGRSKSNKDNKKK